MMNLSIRFHKSLASMKIMTRTVAVYYRDSSAKDHSAVDYFMIMWIRDGVWRKRVLINRDDRR